MSEPPDFSSPLTIIQKQTASRICFFQPRTPAGGAGMNRIGGVASRP